LKDNNLPSIEICCPIALKDFASIKECLKYAVEASNNHISKISLITPKVHFSELQEKFKNSNCLPLVVVLAEEEIVPKFILEGIKDFFGTRSGWVTAEFIKFFFVLNSKQQGVLVIDADTFLLEKTTWLDSNCNQILSVAEVFHLPYFKFLKRNSSLFGNCRQSFMTHYMLMQPKILAEIYENVWSSSEIELWSKVLKFVDFEESSNICICYEAYGNYLYTNRRKIVKLSKWANIAVARSEVLDTDLLSNYGKFYKSVNLHHYL
jgi:hypothetical protein